MFYFIFLHKSRVCLCTKRFTMPPDCQRRDPPVSQSFSCVKAPSFNQGFSRACAETNAITPRREKVFTHKATPARCASLCERVCCIFLGSHTLSFDTQRSQSLRDAPSHGNRPMRVHEEMQTRALTLKSIKQRAGIQRNGLRWVTTTSQ